MKNSDNILPKVNTDEEYEKLKLNSELFKKAALEIVTQHQIKNLELTYLAHLVFQNLIGDQYF